MADVYITSCDHCDKQFKSRNAFKKHVEHKHPGLTIQKNLKYSRNGKDVSYPRAKRISKGAESKYRTWLGELVESINSAHNPMVPSKWYHLEVSNVPKAYLSHLLYDLRSADVNSIREVKHVKPPVWKTCKVPKISYKTYSEDDVMRAFNQNPQTSLVLSKSFEGTKEVVHEGELFGRAALEAAKQHRYRTTLRSQIFIGVGEGRATREMELIWLPLYDTSSSGHMKIRFYIGKVNV